MNIEKIEIYDLKANNPFVSSYWGNLKRINGWINESYQVVDEGTIFQILVLYKNLFLKKKMAYIPFAPICINGKSTLGLDKIKYILNYINLTSTNKILFFRIDLPFEYDNINLLNKDFYINKQSIQPQETIKILLNQNLEELRSNYKTRAKRNLKKNKNNIIVKEVEPSASNINIWYSIYEETAKRDNFQRRSLAYIENLFSIEDAVNSKLILSYKGVEVVGGIILLVAKSESVYLFGASKRLDGFSPSYSLQDYAIQLSKELGVYSYDLFGVGSKESGKHLKSLTLFKSSFGGVLYKRIPTIDYPINRFFYFIFKIAEFFRNLIYR